MSDIPYGNPLSRDRSPEAIYVPLLQAGVTEADVIVRYRTSEVAGRQALHQVFGAVDPLLVPGYVYRAAEVLQKIRPGHHGDGEAVRGLLRLRAAPGRRGHVRPDVAVDRPAHARDRRAPCARRHRRDATRMLLTQGARQLGVGTLVAAPILVAVGMARAHISSP